MPKISVIVPVYKAEKYIEDCVHSILTQSYGDFELILVNDGSPDASGAICDALAAADSRIRVIHKENGGAATARNAGLDVAKGDYIAFVDGDDLIHPQYLEFLLALLEEKQADISWCHYDFFTQEDTCFADPLDIRKEIQNCTMEYGAQMLAEFDRHYRRVSLISLCMKLYKREIFDGLRIPEGQTAEDSLMLPLILERANRIAHCAVKLYHWRETPGSVTRVGLDRTSFHRINIGDNYVKFFHARGMKAQAEYFKGQYLRRVLAYYYKIRRDKPELRKEFAPYLKRYRRVAWTRWMATGLCLRERLAYLLFLICPPAAEKLYRQVHGDGPL